MLLMRQERVVIFFAFEGKETSHAGKEQQVQDRSLGPLGSWFHSVLEMVPVYWLSCQHFGKQL